MNKFTQKLIKGVLFLVMIFSFLLAPSLEFCHAQVSWTSQYLSPNADYQYYMFVFEGSIATAAGGAHHNQAAQSATYTVGLPVYSFNTATFQVVDLGDDSYAGTTGATIANMTGTLLGNSLNGYHMGAAIDVAESHAGGDKCPRFWVESKPGIAQVFTGGVGGARAVGSATPLVTYATMVIRCTTLPITDGFLARSTSVAVVTTGTAAASVAVAGSESVDSASGYIEDVSAQLTIAGDFAYSAVANISSGTTAKSVTATHTETGTTAETTTETHTIAAQVVNDGWEPYTEMSGGTQYKIDLSGAVGMIRFHGVNIAGVTRALLVGLKD